MILSDVVDHLSFIKWFLSIKTQKPSIFGILWSFQTRTYKSICELFPRSSDLQTYSENKRKYWRAPEVRARTNARAKSPKKYCKKITKHLWKSSLDVQNQMFLQKFVLWRNVLYMMKNPQIQVHMKIWIYIVTILYFGRSSLRLAEVVFGWQK